MTEENSSKMSTQWTCGTIYGHRAYKYPLFLQGNLFHWNTLAHELQLGHDLWMKKGLKWQAVGISRILGQMVSTCNPCSGFFFLHSSRRNLHRRWNSWIHINRFFLLIQFTKFFNFFPFLEKLNGKSERTDVFPLSHRSLFVSSKMFRHIDLFLGTYTKYDRNPFR